MAMLTLSIGEQASKITISTSFKEETPTSFRKNIIFSLAIQEDPMSSTSLDIAEGETIISLFSKNT